MSKTIISNDKKSFTLTADEAKLSSYLQSKSDTIDLDFGSAVIEKAVEYLKDFEEKFKSEQVPETLNSNNLKEDIGPNSSKFIEDITDWEIVFNLINCALILNVESLHDLACARVANFMKNYSPEEVQKVFTIECQLTADEAKALGLSEDGQ
jgi:hypothetical protein